MFLNKKINYLKKKSVEIRYEILKTIFDAKKGHIGGALSCVDILITLYFGKILNFNPKLPKKKDRDIFLFSKGHASISLYVILSKLGFFSKNKLKEFNKAAGKIAEHPDQRLPGIEAVSGSLGHGLNIGAGISLANKIDKKNIFTFVLLGDGECYEGTVWEAAMFASHFKLGNLVAIIDRNNLTVLNKTEKIIKLEPFKDKWKSFGWNVITVDGHNYYQLYQKISKIKKAKLSKPTVFIANTVKGKGIREMENQIAWHHGVPSKTMFENAKKELGFKL